MRMLGTRASVPVIRWDLIYLLATLTADDREEVRALAAPIEAVLGELKEERETLEQAEDAAVLLAARRGKRDGKLGVALIQMGGVARATDRRLYDTLFPKYSPSKTARLPLEEEVREADRILGELAVQPEDHPIRVEYEAQIKDALAALRASMNETDQAELALALGRTRLDRFKVRADQARLDTHGKLMSLLKDKVEAEAFFRATTSSPAPATEPGDEAPAPAPAPAFS